LPKFDIRAGLSKGTLLGYLLTVLLE